MPEAFRHPAVLSLTDVTHNFEQQLGINQGLEARVATLEAKLGTLGVLSNAYPHLLTPYKPTNLAFGVAAAEYTAKSESAAFEFATGLSAITSAVATASGEGVYTVNWTAFAGGTIKGLLRNRGIVEEIGVKVSVYWLAIK